MLNKKMTIINKLGLHARAAAKFVQIAASFDSDITLRNNEKEVSGKSIMGIMMLAASKGSDIEIQINGTDEKQAMDTIVALILDRFGEDE